MIEDYFLKSDSFASTSPTATTTTDNTNNTHIGRSIIEGEPIFYSLFLIFGAFFTISCIIITGVLILCHFIHYNKPNHQKYIVRILLIAPIYAIDSWLSLYFKRDYWALFIDVARDCYEAYVLYNFFKLLTCYLGGEEAIYALLTRKDKQRLTFPLSCFSFYPKKNFYLICLQNIIQYAIIKPTLAIVAVILYKFRKYEDSNFSPSQGYLYITIINNISVLLALYFLVMFYEVFQVELNPHRPVLKFLVIKGVIFFTFWQSVLIYILIWFNILPSSKQYDSEKMGYFINDFLVCVEMFITAIAHAFAFSHYDYILPQYNDKLISSKHVGNSSGKSNGEVSLDGADLKNVSSSTASSKTSSFIQSFKSNFNRYSSNIKDGVGDTIGTDIVMDTIKSVKPLTIPKKKRSNKYQTFVDTGGDEEDFNNSSDDDDNDTQGQKFPNYFKIDMSHSNNNDENCNNNNGVNNNNNSTILTNSNLLSKSVIDANSYLIFDNSSNH
ncbi:hypothetical protein CYY_010187 [Polysphondylium violaceum]|uniref:Transmembrane protein n=1 Tax=Polysphondylium violaceum TaxID=133409 RepID=A0A8J4PJG4_9MYCE|nr:hypothetical protein CYY_010187 [Polysphondylium violaceum]